MRRECWFSSKRTARHDELRWGRSLIIAAVMVGLVLLASIIMIQHINHTERERCFERLKQEVDDLAAYVENQVANDREELELLAAVIARQDDLRSPQLWQLLNSLDRVGFMSDLALLLPDNTLLYRNGQSRSMLGKLSFAEESARGAHVSWRYQSLEDPEQFVLRHYVPVVRDGKTVAMLYGLIKLNELPQHITVKPYDGAGARSPAS